MINNKRKIIFAFVLAFAIMIDMISTVLMVESGYKELTGLVVLMINVSYWILGLYVIFWWCFVYFLYPLLERLDLRIHLETIAIYMALWSLLAGIGNFYLYYINL